jgi:predicted amidohydrolase YtcJ
MKNFSKLLLLLSCLIIFTASTCEEEPSGPGGPASGEILYFNGKIYTVNTNQPWAEAMIVKDGRITFIGSDDEVGNQAAEDAEEIDLEGTFLMPGLHDVHLHPLEAVSDNFQFTVADDVEDPEDYAADITTAMQQNPGDDWLLGWGHLITTPLAATRSPKEIIDDVAPNRPVAIMEQTSHSVWCNSKALELMGIEDNTLNPPGGIIMREENGEANGLLIDNAGNMLFNLALAPTPERRQKDYDGLINSALPQLAENGITSVCDARTYWKQDHHEVWQQVADEGKLTVRANLGLWAYPEGDDASQIAMLKTLYSNDPNSLLRINQIKLYSDGIVHNTTSAMHNDYAIDYFELATNNGLNYFTEDRIVAYISELELTGFDFHIHAIGNRGVHEGLNAIARSGRGDGRHRITHVEYVNAADIGRFASLNVTADAQVAGEFSQPEFWHDNDYLIGSALNENNIPLRSLNEAGVRITLSSDWDVSSLNPFIGLQNAVTRAPQALSLEEAIKAYTINSAYVMRQENNVGSLETGKAADFIILDRNPFEIPANQINRIKVEETYLAGTLVFPQ